MIVYPDLNDATESANNLYAIYVAGYDTDKRDEVAKNLWIIQGYAQGLIFSDPDKRTFSENESTWISVIPIVVSMILKLIGRRTADHEPPALFSDKDELLKTLEIIRQNHG